MILANSEVKTVAEFHNASTQSAVTANTSGNMNATTGTFGATTTAQGQSNTTSYDTHWEQQHTKYAVIKYLEDASSAPTDGPQ